MNKGRIKFFRTCMDANGCGANEGKPDTVRSCYEGNETNTNSTGGGNVTNSSF